MFVINDDLSIYVTRGDVAIFTVSAEEDGELHYFQPGDVIRFKVYERKAAENVMLQKDFPVTYTTTAFEIMLTEAETKIGDVISKPTDYWYEVELNPFTNPQTIIGYDEDGAKVLKLFPEGAEVEDTPVDPEDIPVVDEELDLTSTRPIQNQAVARAVAELQYDVSTFNARFDNMRTLKEGSTTADAELHDIRVGHDGTIYSSAGDAVRGQYRQLVGRLDNAAVEAEESARIATECAEISVEAKESAKASEENAKLSEESAYSLVQTAKAYNDQTSELIEEANRRLNLASFEMDEDGYLLYNDDTIYEFEIDDNGMLNYLVSE